MERLRSFAQYISVIFILTLLASNSLFAKTIFVDANAKGSNNGTSWINAYLYLQDAIAAANEGDQIWVAKGIYKPDVGAGKFHGDRSASFELKNGVSYYGGFQSGSTDVNERNPAQNLTVLSGDLNDNDTDVNDLSLLIADPTRSENSCNIVTAKMPTFPKVSILDGFVVEHGNANSFVGSTNGGGLCIGQYSLVNIANCIIRNNASSVGGAIACDYESHLTVTNCDISFNAGTAGGGGIRTANATFTNCKIESNWTSGQGGGIIRCSGALIISKCNISGNVAHEGGGIYLSTGTGGSISDSNITQNSASYRGGGCSGSVPIISNCRINNNTGGGLSYCSSSTIRNCIISNNESAYEGGGLSHCSSTTMVNTLITGNKTAQSGGGLYMFDGSMINCLIANNVAGQNFGALSYCRSTITNCTIVNNTAMINYGGLGIGCSDPICSVRNSIIWGNIPVDNQLTDVQYSCIEGGLVGIGNINQSPKFMDSLNDFRLACDSPCIDACANAWWPDLLPDEDLDENFRQIDGDGDGVIIPDMGAYEYGNVTTPRIAAKPVQFVLIATTDGSQNSVQKMQIWDNGIGVLNWHIALPSVISASSENGISDGNVCDVNVALTSFDLPIGRHHMNLQISDEQASNSPLTIPVTIVMHAKGILRVPSEFLTIQDAIDAAVNGDTIIIDPGIYTGAGNRDIDYKGKAIIVRSTDPNDQSVVASTVIDCNANASDMHRGFYFHNKETKTARLEGITVQHGYINLGGGIYCDSASPVISKCLIKNNNSTYSGGGINNNGGALISNCIITNNNSTQGGGIYGSNIENCIISYNQAQDGGGINGQSVIIKNSKIQNNFASRSGGGVAAAVNLTNCVISNNYAIQCGGGIYTSATLVANCTIVCNTADGYGGGLCCYDITAVSNLYNTILWENKAGQGKAISIYSPISNNKGKISINYSDVQDGITSIYTGGGGTVTWGLGNINSDPHFAFENDYHLMVGSSCIDAGISTVTDPRGRSLIPTSDLEGINRPLDGNLDGAAKADMGAYEFNPAKPCIAVDNDLMNIFIVCGDTNSVQAELEIRNCGGGQLYWNVITSVPWLQPNQSSGINSGNIQTIQFTINAEDLSHGFYNYDLHITDPNNGVERLVRINLTVQKTIKVPSAFPNIQSAIDAATQDNDIILVADGNYTGTGNSEIDFKGKNIIVKSENGARKCVIDCQGSGRAFYFHNNESCSATVDGFTITNCDYGIYLSNISTPSIKNCVISKTKSIAIISQVNQSAKVFISNCQLLGNLGDGIGVAAYGVTFVSDSRIIGNSGSGIKATWSGNINPYLNVYGCTILNNGCSGIDLGSGTMAVRNCTIQNNNLTKGSYYYGINCCDAVISNSIIWDTIHEVSTIINPIITYSDVQGGWQGIGNINSNPLLLPDGHITAGSPCINAGDPNTSCSTLFDIDGEPRGAGGRIDIGVDEYLDSDNDTLPDYWENQYFGSPTIAKPLDDPDHDGISNMDEYKLYFSNPAISSNTYYVDANRPDDSGNGISWKTAKKTIQGAVDLAANSDYVVIARGKYSGSGNYNINPKGKLIIMQSVNPCDSNCVNSTVIDAKMAGSCFVVNNSENIGLRIRGLTITNGYGMGGGISCTNASISVENCIIKNNRAFGGGGGIYLSGSNSQIVNCSILQNYSSMANGGGIYSINSNPSFTNCVIAKNSIAFSSSYSGGAFYCSNSNIAMKNCTISGNFTYKGLGYGGGIYAAAGSNLDVTNTIFWSNSGSGADIYVTATASPAPVPCSVSLRYCDISASNVYKDPNSKVAWGNGNICSDPNFVNAKNMDYHLLPNSPCIDAGDPNSNYSLESEPDGGRIDVGAYGNTSESTSKNGLVILSYNLIGETRVARTTYDYIYSITVKNLTNKSIPRAVFTLGNVSDNVSVIDSDVVIENIDANSVTTSTDTFIVRIDRSIVVDMNSISWNSSITQSSSTASYDLNGDNVIDFKDLNQLIGNWLWTGPAGQIKEDVVKDGIVDFLDFAELAQHWLEGVGS